MTTSPFAYDRAAVIEVMKTAIREAATDDLVRVMRAGCKSLGLEDFEAFDDEVLADIAIDWFGGKGA